MNRKTELRVLPIIGCAIMLINYFFADKIPFAIEPILLAVLIGLCVRSVKLMKDDKKNK